METRDERLDVVSHARLFRSATGGLEPFPVQTHFAHSLPSLVQVPTGLGKTAMVILGWLWRRRFAEQAMRAATPRRLVYCLPMRVLVEQTRENAICWLGGLDALLVAPDIAVHTLMGGKESTDWELHPERDAILIGTQDMLLSRALNRGYAVSRARWPMHFGLLHTDCLWVFDEVQLMGSGLATTAQLEAFRYLLGAKKGNGCRSVWMSATLDPSRLETVDFKGCLATMSEPLTLSVQDEQHPEVAKRRNARKPLQKSTAQMSNAKVLADEILKAHAELRGLTLAVVNTVRRAQELHEVISKGLTDGSVPKLVLLHSRFRPPERERKIKELLSDPLSEGTICVSTQVVEAGVDIDATTLFTELSPWLSLVQRFGRCNRRGERNDSARVFWIDLSEDEKAAEKVALPYDMSQLRQSAEQLKKLTDVGIKSLESIPEVPLLFEHTHVLRKRDLVDLFDTTPDLAGNDIDIDRYVRDIEETDVRVYWRDWDMNAHKTPPDEKAWRQVEREELCPAPIGEFKKFVKHAKAKGKAWRRNYLDGCWERVDESAVYPGQAYLVHASAGGYDPDRGWMGTEGGATVTPIEPVGSVGLNDNAYDDDGLSKTDRWQTISEHTNDVCRELEAIVGALALEAGEQAALRVAARWHDWGKAHEVFQAVLPEGAPRADELWAKASGGWRRYRDVKRPHFRHELASALGVLRPDTPIGDADRDLVAYLIAAHHGKVRLSIRSMPNEARPPADDRRSRRFARGVWDGDTLPQVDLGGDGVTSPEVTLSLEPMEIGLCEAEPFAGQPSWLERALRLRDSLGPFRLAYLEALLRAADWRASATASQEGAPSKPEEFESA